MSDPAQDGPGSGLTVWLAHHRQRARPTTGTYTAYVEFRDKIREPE